MQIITITVMLRDVMPRVTRTLDVPADILLDRLHETLQTAFGWHNAHLYQFCIGEPYQSCAERWAMPGFVDSPEDQPAEKTTLAQALDKTGSAGLTYLYDFGDNWEHEINAAPPTVADPAKTYPRLIGIEGACPPKALADHPATTCSLRPWLIRKNRNTKILRLGMGTYSIQIS